ncbi:MerR family transcriptional regulator [Pedobacter yonginense]|uniref:MerR family transcriptional regulator n=1 Tax=Pedobacter yonginense TaxID=651869 RepID=A0A317EJE7_9SPHI|nr:chaperone modulator CbpM [Pedobacter yonginense]PWS26971.1 MerR family transcriptional regulator [Pedobacter yonginense]
MENNLISIEDICSFYNIEMNFVRSLEEFGLVQTTILKKTVFLNTEELTKLEPYIRLSKELEINLEGIHAVAQLLNQLQKMQSEVLALRNELKFYHHLH